MFFFEKKNQKTFECLGVAFATALLQVQKFFASFFQKRRPCFTAPQATEHCREAVMRRDLSQRQDSCQCHM
jgi:hypothetical protein